MNITVSLSREWKHPSCSLLKTEPKGNKILFSSSLVFAYLHKKTEWNEFIQQFGGDIINTIRKHFSDEKKISLSFEYDTSLSSQDIFFLEKGFLLSQENDTKFSQENSSVNISYANIKNRELLPFIQGIKKAQDLVSRPSNMLSISEMEQEIQEMFASLPVKITVLREKELKKENMNLFLAVNKASSSEAVMILIDYNPKKQKKVDIALVGKGLMYDSGGYYPKPAPYMNEMYGDMAGSATVVSVMQILASQKDLQKRVVGVVSLAENLIDANSYRNGDILTSRKGLTVEVTHTDAEGRLVLADTLSYVCDSFSPEILFDVATLTGSCLRSLGESYTGIISPHKDFIESFESLGETLNDRVHRLPFDPEIKSFVKSKKADLTNTEEKVGGMLGASTAGAFLSYFIDEKVKWAHFDIAGTALREKMRRSYDPQYLLGSGALVHTLAQFILGK